MNRSSERGWSNINNWKK